MSVDLQPSVRYHIVPKDPHAHLFEVTCSVAQPDVAGQCFAMPAWIPGSYMIRDFAKHVVRVQAQDSRGLVEVEKLDKQTWRCAPCAGALRFQCEIYAWDLSVRGAHFDQSHAYFNGTSVFPAVVGREDEACLVDICVPPGDASAHWKVATTLARAGAAPEGFGCYRAENYADLIDHPVEIGDPTLLEFEACGVPHMLALTGRHRADLPRLGRDLARICEHHIRFFGEPAPLSRYLFLVTVVGKGYGGLEHRSSCSLLCSRNDLPVEGDGEVREGYRTLLGLISHEYFHTWNVKRIRPDAFEPYDLSREVHTRLLWAFEGITSYYDDLALVRCGLISVDSYLELLGRTITRVLRGPGRRKQSVAESSFDAWTKFYRQDENGPNAIVSYYTKGALVALALDLTLRERTGDRVSLDDVMRALWARYGTTGIGVAEDGVERLCEEVSGLDLRAFFDQAVRGTDDLDFARLLGGMGIEFGLRPAESLADTGGRPAAAPLERLAARPALGAVLSESGPPARLAHVLDGGPAQLAGLAAGDEIVALDGLRVDRASLEQLLGSYPCGTTLRVTAFRGDVLFEVALALTPALRDTCWLTVRDEDAAVRARRESWLGQPAGS